METYLINIERYAAGERFPLTLMYEGSAVRDGDDKDIIRLSPGIEGGMYISVNNGVHYHVPIAQVYKLVALIEGIELPESMFK